MFNRILVPLDGSSLAERVIPHAELFARIFGSSIILLQVLDPTSYHENPNPIDPLNWQIRKAEADMYLKGIAARIQKDLSEDSLAISEEANREDEVKKVVVEYAIREGKPAENIINFAHSEGIDLLVISTHGSGGFSRWNISSVTQKVINLIYLPVLIVRAYIQPEVEQTRVAYRHILLPIDSSRRAECSLSAGIALTRGEISAGLTIVDNSASLPESKFTKIPLLPKLILAAVVNAPEIPIPEPYPVEIEKLSKRLMLASVQAVRNYMNEMKERLAVDCEACIVENKSVSLAIHELASQDEQVDLVVLCAHGYTGEFNLPYGSVARNYMEHGTKTVLVIQDVPRSQVRPTAAEISAEKSGGR